MNTTTDVYRQESPTRKLRRIKRLLSMYGNANWNIGHALGAAGDEGINAKVWKAMLRRRAEGRRKLEQAIADVAGCGPVPDDLDA